MHPQERANLLIFYQKIDQTIKKEITKIDNEKIHRGVIFRKLKK